MGVANLDLLTVGVVVAATCALGFSVYFTDRESATNRTFLSFSVVTALWGVINYLSYQFSDPALALWLLRGILFFATFQAFFLYEFFAVFPERTRTRSSRHTYILVPIVILTALVTLSPFAFSGFVGSVAAGQVAVVSVGPGVALFALVAVGLVVRAVWLLIRTLRRSSGPMRRAVSLILIGTAATFALIIFFNLVLSIVFTDPDYVPLGALFMFPFIAFSAYAIMHEHLFNIKTIAASALVFFLAVVSIIDLIFSNTLPEILLRSSVFVLVLVFGIMLIKSVLKEVEQREQIEQLSQQKSEFMSFASHEIRNPITAMRGFASLIVDGTVEDGQAKSVAQKILVNGDTVLSLISEYLNKSKVELGQISYNIADVDLGKLIESMAEGFKPHANEKGLALEIKIAFPGLVAKADEAKLREIIGNLIDNSIKYTKTGTVTVTVEKRNGMGRIIVSDTGVGIPPETSPHLFQKFSRADAQKMNLLGTGLGLFLAKTFVEGMGGKIWAESDGKDKGSRFIIELHTV